MALATMATATMALATMALRAKAQRPFSYLQLPSYTPLGPRRAKSHQGLARLLRPGK